jgi:hypothetical protein
MTDFTPVPANDTCTPTDYTITDQQAAVDSDDNGKRRAPQRDRIVEVLLAAGVTFWRDRDGYAFATVRRQELIERHRVESRRFKLLIRSIYGAAFPTMSSRGSIPGGVSDSALAEAIQTFEAMALAGDIREPNVRVMHEQGAVWLDLCNEDWQLIRVTGEGWHPISAADIPLIRPDGLRGLPNPVHDVTALESLRRLLNVSTEPDLRLVVAWLVGALYPSGPYPVLAIDGEAGSGKSTVCKMLRRLIDPNKADLRAPPRNEGDLLIAAMNGRIVALDNVSYIEAEMADALCRLATDAGLSKRTLYTDGEEHIVCVARPVLLNGIPSLLARGDLADRAIAITLPPIEDEARRPETEIWRDFDAAAPGILALLAIAPTADRRETPAAGWGSKRCIGL